MNIINLIVGSNPLLTTGVGVVASFFGYKFFDKFLFKHVVKLFDPVKVVRKLVKLLEKQAKILEDFVRYIDDKYIDKRKKKFPKSTEHVESQLVDSISILQESLNGSFDRIIKIINDE